MKQTNSVQRDLLPSVIK
uniref:Uncharacterized protein n=1 Tax=Arundo donax TaxID=35708 RepID=A0A0A9B3V8_ARUDO